MATQRRDVTRWTALSVAVVIVIAGLLIAGNPRIRCKVTLGMWVPEHQVARVTKDDTSWLLYYAEPARCVS